MISAAYATKQFTEVTIFDGLCFDANPNSICAILGPTACGKSTLLNIIAGLDHLDSGDISIPARTKVAYMMQDSLLLPWRNLEENVTLGAEVQNSNKPNSTKIQSYLKNVELWPDRAKSPAMASGGMMQRVALIRTLLLEPDLLLLDEPFSSLDFDTKLKVQRFLLKIQRESGCTILWVTHDIEDAIALSDRIVVLSSKPTKVKAVIDIELGSGIRKPLEVRKSQKFREYFSEILDQLKYLDNSDAA